MKTRNSLVSNSSSSNFIILLKENPTECNVCHRKDPDLINLIEAMSLHNDDNDVHEVGKEEIIKHFECEDWYGNQDLKNKMLDLVKNTSDVGYKMVYVEISYHADAIHVVLDNLVKSGNAKVIYNSEA